MSTEGDRYEGVQDIYAAARDLPEGKRGKFLDMKCGEESDTRQEVESLLAHAETKPGFLEKPPLRHSTAEEEEADTELPAFVGNYRVIRLLGEGAFGRVYLAEQESPKKRVAVKVLRRAAVDARALRLFELEPELLARLKHPGVAEVYHAGADESGNPFFALEYVEGLSLTQHARENSLGTRARLELFTKVCDAVEHAHQRGVIHRDLKPANILVTSSGQPKVLDFGIARLTVAGMKNWLKMVGGR